LRVHPRLYCPKCRKRVSPEGDTVGFDAGRMPVIHCPHCGEESEVVS
jgi:endogenous inhibitor of DNA gyrase (YacG/DUF329 family)